MNRSEMLLIDPAKLYWAPIPSELSKRNTEALDYAFEGSLPVPIETVESRYAFTDDGRIVGCAIELSELSRLIEGADRAVESVRPSSSPAWLEIDEQALGALEFRSGSHASPRARRERRRITATATTTLAVLAASLLLGMELRRSLAIERTASVQTDARDIALATLGLAADDVGSTDPLLFLTAERRRLTLTRESGQQVRPPESVSMHLTDLLTAWPEDIPTRVDTLDISDDRATIAGTLREASALDALRTAIEQSGSGWSEQASRVARDRPGFLFTLTLARDAEGEER